MENTSSNVRRVPFFEALREGISTIYKDVLEIEKEMNAPSERSEDKALTKLVNMAEEIKEKKASAIKIKKDLEMSNECNHRYFTHMQSLVESMEGRLKAVTNHLKQFGYVPIPDTKDNNPPCEANQVVNGNVTVASDVSKNVENKDAASNNNVHNNAGIKDMKTPICLSTNTYSTFNKLAIKGECLFPPVPKHYNTSSPSVPDNHLALTDYSTISGGSTHIENSSFNLKLGDEKSLSVETNNESNSPELPVLTSLRETRKPEKDKVLTPEDPFLFHNRGKINTGKIHTPEDPSALISNINKIKLNTPDDPVTSVYNMNKKRQDTPEEPLIHHNSSKPRHDTPEDPPIFHYSHKDDAPQTPKTPELTSNFRAYHF